MRPYHPGVNAWAREKPGGLCCLPRRVFEGDVYSVLLGFLSVRGVVLRLDDRLGVVLSLRGSVRVSVRGSLRVSAGLSLAMS